MRKRTAKASDMTTDPLGQALRDLAARTNCEPLRVWLEALADDPAARASAVARTKSRPRPGAKPRTPRGALVERPAQQ